MLKKTNIILIGICALVILMSVNLLSAVIICQYANSATTTSDNQNSTGSLAGYATGAPNAPDRQSIDQCTVWSGYGYSWSPRNWNIISNLTLKYNTPVKVTNFTVLGDYDMCWQRAILKDSNTLQEYVVFDNEERSCVLTKNLNKAVNRNIDRFPKDFMFQVSSNEFKNLMFHFGTSSWGGTRKRPRVFTEHGILMLSSVLRSKKAVQANIVIMRTFVRLRRMLASNDALSRKLKELEKKYDEQFQVVFEAIRQILTPPEKPKRPFGFSIEEPKILYTIRKAKK